MTNGLALNGEATPGVRALVIGGAKGIGRSLANGLAGQNVELIIADHDGPALRRAAAQTGAQGIFCDVMSQASMEIFRTDIIDRFPSIDLLINAAGTGYVRTLCAVRMSIAMLPMLRRARSQRQIVHVASPDNAARDASRFCYASSMEAFHSSCAGLAEQIRGSAVETSMIVPGLGRGGRQGRSLTWHEDGGRLTTLLGSHQLDFDLLASWLIQRITPGQSAAPNALRGILPAALPTERAAGRSCGFRRYS